VAIMREGEVLPSPGPDVVLHTGDLLVAVGTQEGLDSAADILRNG
jgi:TrkA domain protein